MKLSYRKLPSSWRITTIPLLTRITLFFPFAALAEQSASTLEERIQQMEVELQMLRRELTRTQQPVQQIEQLEKRVASVEKPLHKQEATWSFSGVAILS